MATQRAEVTVAPNDGSPISPLIFGALTEHFGTGIYGGIWDVEHRHARADITAATRALAVRMLRYPGGCFSAAYDWSDGIGDPSGRPVHDRTFWTDFPLVPSALARRFGPPETNAFGTDEFLQFCLDVDAEPLLVTNIADDDAELAAAWVWHCNRSGAAPRQVTRWAIGNETYGGHEPGHCPPAEYAARFRHFAEAMGDVDPSLILTAVGCLDPTLEKYPDWNETVVRNAGDVIDLLSVHQYFPGYRVGRPMRDDDADYARVALGAEGFGHLLDDVLQRIDAVGGSHIRISLDEWNMWSHWSELLTANHRLCDALYFAGCLNRVLRRADRIEVACISHLVNCMGPIQTRGDRHFVTAAYLTLLLYGHHVREYSVPVVVQAGTLSAPDFEEAGHSGKPDTPREVRGPALDVSASRGGGGTTVFLANRHLSDKMLVEVRGLPAGSARFRMLTGPGPFARNEIDSPATLYFHDMPAEVTSRGGCKIMIPQHTVGALICGRPIRRG